MEFKTKFLCGLALIAASTLSYAGNISGAYITKVGAYDGSPSDGIGGIVVLDRPVNNKPGCSSGDGSTLYIASSDSAAVSRMLGVAMTAKIKQVPVRVDGTGNCVANAESIYFIGLE